jgi:hypothetical protein
VFNKTYQLRAALLRLPAPWRPFVTVAAIAEEFYRPKHRPQPRPPQPGQKPVARFEQLELFPPGPADCPQIDAGSRPTTLRPFSRGLQLKLRCQAMPASPGRAIR